MTFYVCQIGFERTTAVSELLSDELQGAYGWVAISKDFVYHSRELLSAALAKLGLRLLDISDIVELESIEHVAEIDEHLASNVHNWQPNTEWVWGTIHGYYGDGEA